MDPLRVTKGDTLDIDLEFTDENDAAVDITGAKIYLTCKDIDDYNDNDVDALFQYIQLVHTGAANGKSNIKVLPSDTRKLTPGNIYSMDIQLVLSPDDIHTPLKTRLYCEKETTVSS